MILVDSNVLFDIVTDNQEWFEWSKAALERAEALGPLGINDVVFAELSVRFPSLEAVEQAVPDLGLTMLPMPRAALFLAGKAFDNYRHKEGGTKTGVLPDFFIGAHALVLEVPLLTRDTKRYRTYFKSLDLITP